MFSWEEKWQIKMNPELCEVMHLWRSGNEKEYIINGGAFHDVELGV